MFLQRPRQDRVARWVLAAALYIPAGALIERSGLNSLSLTFIVAVLLASIGLVAGARRAVVVCTASGIELRAPAGREQTFLSWSEVAGIDRRAEGVLIRRYREHPVQVKLDPRDANRLIAEAEARRPAWDQSLIGRESQHQPRR